MLIQILFYRLKYKIPTKFYKTLYRALLTMWCADVCIFNNSSLIRRVISIFALETANSSVLSIAKNNLRSPSGGFLGGG